MIDVLPNDLLVKILMFVPIKDAVATMILSKRWFSIWTMMPSLSYIDTNDSEDKSVWQFIDKSLNLHKAPVLNLVDVELGPQCPVDVDVTNWIKDLIDRKVRCRWLAFTLKWSAGPIKLPDILCTYNTLIGLILADNILVDIVSPACLPSLQCLCLYTVTFKEEDSLVKLLSSSPILKFLHVRRHKEDNVKNFKLKVSFLECFLYHNYKEYDWEVQRGSLVIDCPALKTINIWDISGDFFTIKNIPRLDQAMILVSEHPGDIKFMFSSLVFFDIYLSKTEVKACTTINFPQLVECRIQPLDLDWLEPVMVLLQNSPKLKVLVIDQVSAENEVPLSWKRPCSIPKCLLTDLKIFELNGYEGKSGEKEFVRYILANSRCLKRAAISMKATCNLQEKEKMMNEVESMSMISRSCQLMYIPVFLKDEYEERTNRFLRPPPSVV